MIYLWIYFTITMAITLFLYGRDENDLKTPIIMVVFLPFIVIINAFIIFFLRKIYHLKARIIFKESIPPCSVTMYELLGRPHGDYKFGEYTRGLFKDMTNGEKLYYLFLSGRDENDSRVKEMLSRVDYKEHVYVIYKDRVVKCKFLILSNAVRFAVYYSDDNYKYSLESMEGMVDFLGGRTRIIRAMSKDIFRNRESAEHELIERGAQNEVSKESNE